MGWYRAYLNKSKGNEHSRVVDLEAKDEDSALAAANHEAKRGEVVEQIVELAGPPEES